MGEPLNVDIIGCGVIAAQYLTTIEQVPGLRLVAVSDWWLSPTARSPS